MPPGVELGDAEALGTSATDAADREVALVVRRATRMLIRSNWLPSIGEYGGYCPGTFLTCYNGNHRHGRQPERSSVPTLGCP